MLVHPLCQETLCTGNGLKTGGAIIASKMQGDADDHFGVVQTDITTGYVLVVCQLWEGSTDVVVVQVYGAAWVRSC